MAFSRAWDEAFPPDTQLANLLGLDIREFKVDTRERLRDFGAGPIANRPTPEEVFGSATTGVTYYANDEDKLYSWNGTAWVIVSVHRNLVDSSVVTINPIPPGDTDGNSVTIPANFLQTGDVIDVTGRFKTTVLGSGSKTVNIQFGSTVINGVGVSSATGQGYITGSILQVGSSSQRAAFLVGFRETTDPGATVASRVVDPTEDESLAIIVKSFVRNGSTAGTIIFDYLNVRITHQ